MQSMTHQQAIKLLEITGEASEENIKRAYKKLARKYHPDLHMTKPEKEQEFYKEKFQEITQAYNLLMGKEEWAGGTINIPSYEEILNAGAFGTFVKDIDTLKYKPKGKSQREMVDNLVKDIKETRGN